MALLFATRFFMRTQKTVESASLIVWTGLQPPGNVATVSSFGEFA